MFSKKGGVKSWTVSVLVIISTIIILILVFNLLILALPFAVIIFVLGYLIRLLNRLKKKAPRSYLNVDVKVKKPEENLKKLKKLKVLKWNR